MKTKLLLFTSLVIMASSCASLMKSIKPSAFETISAIKEILNSSTFRALASLKKMSSDDPGQALPSEVNTVLNALSTLGFGSEIEKSKKVIGQASGLMLTESQGILTDAIKEVDLGDAVAIVTGGPDAATQVLKNNMKLVVKKRYSDKLNVELDKSDVNKYWPIAASAFNMFSKTKVDSKLSDFLAERAVDGMFLAIGHEEQQIRKDPASLGKAVVTKVFDYYKNKSQ